MSVREIHHCVEVVGALTRKALTRASVQRDMSSHQTARLVKVCMTHLINKDFLLL